MRVATVATYDHLHQTIAMVRSLRAVCAGPVEVHVALVDQHHRERPGLDVDVVVHDPVDLGVDRFGWLATKYLPGDLCGALKPYLVGRLLAGSDATPVLYVDSDIVFYDEPADLLAHVPDAPMVLTPHVTEPSGAGTRALPSMGEIATAGMCNSGLFVARPAAATRRFLDQWADLCVQPGAFLERFRRQTEQQSFNWATSFVPGVTVHADRRCHVAYWNRQERPIRWAGLDGRPGGAELDGRPIVCFHFSGYRPGGDELSRYGQQVPLSLDPTTTALCRDYDERLAAAGMAHYAPAGYEFATCEGVPILPGIRTALREAEEQLVLGDGPFAEVAPDALRQLHRALAPGLSVPAYVPAAIATRHDVRDALVTPGRLHAGPLLRWFDDGFLHEHPEGRTFDRFASWIVDRRVIDDFAAELAAAVDGLDVAEAGRLLRHDRAGALDRLGDAAPTLREKVLDNRYRIVDVEPVTCLRLLHDERPDLQAAFPDPLGADLPGFRSWLATELPGQYELTPEVAAASTLPIEGALARVVGWLARHDDQLDEVRRDGITPIVLLRLSLAAAVEPGIARSDVHLVEWWLDGRGDDERAAVLDPALAASLDGPAGTRWLARWSERHAPDLAPAAVRAHVADQQAAAVAAAATSPAAGVNLFGYHRSPIGIGTMSRGMGAALVAAGVPVQRPLLVNPTMAPDLALDDLDPAYGFAFPVDLLVSYPHLPHDPFRRFPVECRAPLRVAYLAWEQRDTHPRWAATYEPYDAVWALSSFTADALADGLGRPVDPVSCVVEVAPDPGIGRADFDLPAAAFVVAVVLDATSAIERKNPLGAARALAAAFAGRRDVVVVLKVNGGALAPYAPSVRAVVAALVDAGLDVRLHTAVLPVGRLHALVRCCDLVLSLHRAEGFGYNLAEAMALGVPVVASGCSGNLDFMHAGNSLLVPCREVVVQRGEGPFVPGSVWSEPDHDSAVDACRSVYDDPAAAAARAVVAEREVAASLSAVAIGARVRGLLTALA